MDLELYKRLKDIVEKKQKEDEPYKYAHPSKEYLETLREDIAKSKMTATVEWHDASRELPPTNMSVLALTYRGEYIVTATYKLDGKIGWDGLSGNLRKNITHWCHFPKAPGKK
jgi:hypothetical protein